MFRHPVTLNFDLWPLTFTGITKVTHVHLHTKFGANRPNTWQDVNFFLVNLAKITDKQKATPKSPLCICTGGLKNLRFCCPFCWGGASLRVWSSNLLRLCRLHGITIGVCPCNTCLFSFSNTARPDMSEPNAITQYLKNVKNQTWDEQVPTEMVSQNE